jgi:MOSC domain-containing protein YiiM
MMELQSVKAVAGVGLEGDRYARKDGTFSGKRDDIRHVTLISASDVALSNAQLEIPYALRETRRNLVVDGAIALLDLIGKEFTVGTVRLRGVEEAAPCTYAQRLAKKPGFAVAFVGRAGIRAELLTGGVLTVGDQVVVE